MKIDSSLTPPPAGRLQRSSIEVFFQRDEEHSGGRVGGSLSIKAVGDCPRMLGAIVRTVRKDPVQRILPVTFRSHPPGSTPWGLDVE